MKLRKLRERLKRRKRWRNYVILVKYQQRLEKEVLKARRPLPYFTKALTTTSIHGGTDQTCPNFNDQLNSLLFNKLPFDLREQIYRLVIGDKCIHIVRKSRHLAFLFCRAQNPRSHDADACWGYENDDGTFRSRDNLLARPDLKLPLEKDDDQAALRETDRGLLPLLLSCRKV
jgi:hypothetical protein